MMLKDMVQSLKHSSAHNAPRQLCRRTRLRQDLHILDVEDEHGVFRNVLKLFIPAVEPGTFERPRLARNELAGSPRVNTVSCCLTTKSAGLSSIRFLSATRAPA